MVLCKNCKTGALAVRSLCNDGQGLFILPSFPPSIIPASVIPAFHHPRFRHSRLPSSPLPSFPPSVIPAFCHSCLPSLLPSVIPVFRHFSLPSFPLPSFPRKRESTAPCHMTNSRWQGCMDSRSPTRFRDKLRGNDGLLSRIHYWFRRLIIGTRQVASAQNREWRLLRPAHNGTTQELRNRGPSKALKTGGTRP